MKINRFILSSFLLMSLFGCSEEQTYEPQQQEISIWAGEKTHVNIDIDPAYYNYVLKTDNSKIATATLDDDKMGVNITAHDRGDTKIWLADNDTEKVIYKISISVKYFNGSDIRDMGFPVKGYPAIIVKATNTEIKEKIENELRTEGEPFSDTMYTFNGSTKKFTMTTHSGIFKEGSYEWDITSLTLNYNNKIEKFGFEFAAGAAVGMSYAYIIQADKTEQYQQQYPDTGITEVKVNRLWHNRAVIYPGGLIF